MSTSTVLYRFLTRGRLRSAKETKPLSTTVRDSIAAFWCRWPYNIVAYPFVAPLAEILYYFETRRYRAEQSRRDHTSYHSSDALEGLRFWHTLLAEADAESAEAMVCAWFGGSYPARRDVERFIGWSIYNSLELDPAQRETTELVASRVEAAIGKPFAPPTDEWMPCMIYSVHDLQAGPVHLPLFMYLLFQTLHKAVDALLARHGFRLLHVDAESVGATPTTTEAARTSHAVGARGGGANSGDDLADGEWQTRQVATGAARLAYWYRPPVCAAEAALEGGSAPVVFLHGVLGFAPYLLTLYQLATRHKGALLLPVFPSASIPAPLQPAHQPGAPRAAALVCSLRLMLMRHTPHGQQPRAAWFGHSLGSAVLASVLKQAPELASGAVFSDPICFELASGDVLRNFLYARPARRPADWYKLVQAIFVSGEASIQFCFRRTFWWAHAWLHPNDLPCDTVVILSAHDTVANAESVRRHFALWQANRGLCARPRCRVRLHPHWYHGFMMFQPAAQRRIIDDLLLMAAAAPATTSGAQLPLQAVSSRNRLEGLDSVQPLGGRAGAPPEKPKRVRFDDRHAAEGEGATETESLGSTWGESHSTAWSADERCVPAPRSQ